MGWLLYFIGWLVALWILIESLATVALVETVGQETVFWVKVAIGVLGLILAALGAMLNRMAAPPGDG